MRKHFHPYDAVILSKIFKPRDRVSQKYDHPLELNIPKDDERGIQLNFFYYRTVKAWNEFPKVVAHANIINMFKSKLTGPWKELTLKFCEQYSS